MICMLGTSGKKCGRMSETSGKHDETCDFFGVLLDVCCESNFSWGKELV
jgi:hypothetical protein